MNRAGGDRVSAARRRKYAVLGGLGLVLAAIWGRNALDLVPRDASAGPEPGAAEVASEAADRAHRRDPVRLARPSGGPRNPFAIDHSAYARQPAGPAPDVEPAAPAPPAREAVESAAAALALQATFLGESPQAMINGRALRVGESIDGFLVRSIGARVVVVERDGIAVELSM